MNELEIKKVPFLGAELMAARDADGQIWAGVRWMCDGIGLNENQARAERKKIQADKVLSKGGAHLTLPTKGGNQDVLCLKLDFVPLWLAKISITPTMEAETPELAETLMEYQLKAKDVLAAAFLPLEVRMLHPLLYSPKATSLGEVARFLSVMVRTMEKNHQPSEAISKAFETICVQFGIVLPADFVRVPTFQQLTIT